MGGPPRCPDWIPGRHTRAVVCLPVGRVTRVSLRDVRCSPPGPKDLLSDRCVLSCPSMDLVTCLLDFRLNLASNRSIVPRLAASLAACAQLSALGRGVLVAESVSESPLVRGAVPSCRVCPLSSCQPPHVGPAEAEEAADDGVRTVGQHPPAAGRQRRGGARPGRSPAGASSARSEAAPLAPAFPLGLPETGGGQAGLCPGRALVLLHTRAGALMLTAGLSGL